MGLLIDIISLAIIVILVCMGVKTGFIKSVMGLASLILSLIIAVNLFQYTAAFVKDNYVQPYFVKKTSGTFLALMNGGTEVIPPQKVFEDEPQTLSDTADKFGLEVSQIRDYYENVVANTTDSFNTEEIATRLSEFVVQSTVDTISNVLGFAITFIAALIALTLLVLLLGLIFKLPALNLANKLLGGALGALKAAVIVIVVVNIVYNLAAASGNNTDSASGIEKFWSADAVVSSVSYSITDSVGLIF